MITHEAGSAALAVRVESTLVRLAQLLLRTGAQPVSRTALSVLACLREAGPQRVTDLAAREAVAQPSMTALVGRLGREGRVAAPPAPDDRAAVRVAVTPAGVEMLSERQAARAAAVGEVLARLDERQ